jgi:DNA-binding transcriptional MerR regulator
MGLLSTGDVKRIERKHAEGISSSAVVELFQQKGERFSEATLRKYVQLGLLPKSRRVGAAGRHRGSSGLYPVAIVRQINDIKRALEAGGTLEEIRVSRVGVSGEVEALERAAQQVFDLVGEALDKADKTKRPRLKKDYERYKRALTDNLRGLSKFAMTLGSGARG